MTIERAIEILDPERKERFSSIEPVNEARRIAVAALHELQKRQRGCKFCCYTEHPDKTLFRKENVGYDFAAGYSKQHAADDIEVFETTAVKFCPMCGRKLEDESNG